MITEFTRVDISQPRFGDVFKYKLAGNGQLETRT